MLLDKLWDDTMAGPHPERGLGKLRKLPTLNVTPTDGDNENKFQRSLSVPSSSSGSPGAPTTPTTPSTPTSARKVDVWRSVFNPGSNLNSRSVGAQIFDKPTHPSSPTVYDWLYSGDTKSRHM